MLKGDEGGEDERQKAKKKNAAKDKPVKKGSSDTNQKKDKHDGDQ